MGNNYKRILDSVHGYIKIRKSLFKDIIDTPNFQRLRHIEQTSSRSIFPCARHDRFIHSLGVFHLGHKIIEAIEQTIESKHFPQKEMVYNTFRAACLLHDVGHSPFSHTFEQFYDNDYNRLIELLKDEIDNQGFTEDVDKCFQDSAPHEIMSAYILTKTYSKIAHKYNVDIELAVRMIIGCLYHKEANSHSFENAFIQLIHGNVIDADGLDYVCRDSWASGYSTARVDIDRLIESIRIVIDTNQQYQVCYTPKSMNEIEAVLSVKTFQQANVITHHTVVYEQHLLIKAMESAALYHFDIQYTEDDIAREVALNRLCNIKTMYETIILPKHQIPFSLPMDDDFISLMKYIPEDKYVKQWFSRQYDLVPLWKSKADFYNLFPIFTKAKITKENWLFSEDCKTFISVTFGIPEIDIWILDAQHKDKGYHASTINLLVNGEIKPYTALFSNDKNSYIPDIQPFFYIYVPKKHKGEKDEIIKRLKKEVNKFIFNRSE